MARITKSCSLAVLEIPYVVYKGVARLSLICGQAVYKMGIYALFCVVTE